MGEPHAFCFGPRLCGRRDDARIFGECRLRRERRSRCFPVPAHFSAFHARELPQRDDLCGAFCAALALRAGGIEEHRGDPVDQDAVALAAGSIVSAVADTEILPFDEQGRRDYRLEIPTVQDSAVSGTTAGGLARAVEELSGGRLAAIPYSGPWTADALDGLFEARPRIDPSGDARGELRHTSSVGSATTHR